MPKMHIDKSIEINAPVDQVWNKIADYHHWKDWSPWLIMDPDAQVDIDSDGKSYSWKGERVGAGEMKVTDEKDNERIDMDLTFLTPYKSHAKVWFTLHGDNGKTKLHWGMDSSMPFFLFWMTKTMTVLVGMDYDRGLTMLKDLVEKGDVPCQLEEEGEMDFPGCQYVAIQREASVNELGPVMEKDIAELKEWMKSSNLSPSYSPFCQYHKWDLKKGRTKYTLGYPLEEIPSEIPSNFMIGNIPATKVYSIKLTGPYRYIGNAWSMGQNLMRSKVFKGSKKIHPFESYANNPEDTPENDLVTRIMFPLR